jgi:hypothetical protein
MGIVSYLLLVVVVGLVVALIQWFAPIDPKFKQLALWAGVIFCVLVLLYAIGVFPLVDRPIPQVR